MKIQVIPSDYLRANEINVIVGRVVQQHPLVTKDMSYVAKQLHDLTIQIMIMQDFDPIGMPKNIDNNKLDLRFDPCRYSNPGEMEKILFHEFSHLIDRLNPGFGLDEQKECQAQNMQPKEISLAGFLLYEHIWNCYIDGRLSEFGKNPRTLKERTNELCDSLKNQGDFEPCFGRVLQQAWQGKGFSFDDIIELTRKCLQVWHPSFST